MQIVSIGDNFMKRQILLSGKNKKYVSMSSAEKFIQNAKR